MPCVPRGQCFYPGGSATQGQALLTRFASPMFLAHVPISLQLLVLQPFPVSCLTAGLVCVRLASAWRKCVSNNVVHSIMNGMHNSRTSSCQDQLLVHRYRKNMANALGKPFKTDQTFVAYKSLFALKPTCAEGSKLVLDRLACRH